AALALRSDGALAVSSPNDNRVEVITSTSPGTQIAAYVGMNQPDTFAIDSAGYVYVGKVNAFQQSLIRIDPNGKRGVVFAPGSASSALVFDDAGMLYSAEQSGEVYRYDPATGARTFVARSSDNASLNPNDTGNMLTGLLVLPTGEIYGTDTGL